MLMNVLIVLLAGFAVGVISMGFLCWYLRSRTMKELLNRTDLACREATRSVRDNSGQAGTDSMAIRALSAPDAHPAVMPQHLILV